MSKKFEKIFFFIQYVNYLQNPVKIKRDDELLLNCVYNSEYTDKFIFGGHGTNEEMWYV